MYIYCKKILRSLDCSPDETTQPLPSSPYLYPGALILMPALILILNPCLCLPVPEILDRAEYPETDKKDSLDTILPSFPPQNCLPLIYPSLLELNFRLNWMSRDKTLQTKHDPVNDTYLPVSVR